MQAFDILSVPVWSSTHPPCPDKADDLVLVALQASDAPDFLAAIRRLVPKSAVVLNPHDVLKAVRPAGARRLQPELTGRQREIVALLAEGLSNKKIARRLGLSHFTVRNHVSQVLRAFNLATRQHAIALFKAGTAPQDQNGAAFE